MRDQSLPTSPPLPPISQDPLSTIHRDDGDAGGSNHTFETLLRQVDETRWPKNMMERPLQDLVTPDPRPDTEEGGNHYSPSDVGDRQAPDNTPLRRRGSAASFGSGSGSVASFSSAGSYTKGTDMPSRPQRALWQQPPSGKGEKRDGPESIARARVPLGCVQCRMRKVRCDYKRPRCGRCVERNEACAYSKRSPPP
jgi:hypothetical protein